MFADQQSELIVAIVIAVVSVRSVVRLPDAANVDYDLSAVARRLHAAERKARRQTEHANQSGEKIARPFEGHA